MRFKKLSVGKAEKCVLWLSIAVVKKVTKKGIYHLCVKRNVHPLRVKRHITLNLLSDKLLIFLVIKKINNVEFFYMNQYKIIFSSLCNAIQ